MLLGPSSLITTPKEVPGRTHVYHLYVIEVDDRDTVADKLREAGIPTVVNYRKALPFLPCYAHFGHRAADFPIAARLQDRIMSLPIFAEITPSQQQKVAGALLACLQ
jgi:dTDP-4-amino-4,6-dideoxygalactose transaminase